MVWRKTTATALPIVLTRKFKAVVFHAIFSDGCCIQFHRQANAFAWHIDFEHFDFHDIASFHNLTCIGDELIAQLADMDEPILVNAQIDECAKYRHVTHCAFEHHVYF